MIDQLLDTNSPPRWGLQFSTSESLSGWKSGLPKGCPEWASVVQQQEWCSEGLVAWNNETHELAALTDWEAVALMERLRDTTGWKTAGDCITKHVTVLTIKEPQTRGGPRKPEQAADPNADDEPATSKAEEIDREIVVLNPDACQAVLQFLRRNEKALRDLYQAAEAEQRRVLVRVYDTIFRSYRTHEFENIPLNERGLPWTKDVGQHRLTSEAGSNRAIVSTDNTLLSFWHVAIECHQKVSRRSPHFDKLTEALDWAEKELNAPPDSPEPVEEEETFPPSTMDLRPYEITPAALEPARITYRTFIELEHVSLRHKTLELSSGGSLDYDHEYPTSAQLAQSLGLAAERLDIQQVLEDTGWYRIRGLTTLFQESMVVTQAQALWDRSVIVQQYKAKQVDWAYFGYQEAETGYTVFLGGCESPTHASPKPQPRADYLAEKAKRLTLIHALDVVGFRAYLQLSRKWQDDAGLLRSMHQQRAESQFIPLAAREESQRWLSDHPASTNK